MGYAFSCIMEIRYVGLGLSRSFAGDNICKSTANGPGHLVLAPRSRPLHVGHTVDLANIPGPGSAIDRLAQHIMYIFFFFVVFS